MAIGLHPVFTYKETNVDSGFYAACAGLRAQSQALEVVAHNLANLDTVGFRGQATIPIADGGIAARGSEWA